MLWVKGFHVITMVTWFSGLFYLPRLFIYHQQASDQISIDRFKVMERRLYYGITTPSAVITILLGFWMLNDYAWELYKTQGWLHVKLGLVLVLVIYHLLCGYYIGQFRKDKNIRSTFYFKLFNEFPILILIPAILMVIVKPF